MLNYDFFNILLPIILLSIVCIVSYSAGRIHERYIYKAYLKEVLQKCESCGTLNEAVRRLMEKTTDEKYTDWRRGGGYPN